MFNFNKTVQAVALLQAFAEYGQAVAIQSGYSIQIAQEGETCGGFNEKTGSPFPNCDYGLKCQASGGFGISGAGNVCVAVEPLNIEGTYEELDYIGGPNENDWHHVTISSLGGDAFKWENEAGVSWTLY